MSFSRRDLLAATAVCAVESCCRQPIVDPVCPTAYGDPGKSSCGPRPASPPPAVSTPTAQAGKPSSCELLSFDELQRATPSEVFRPSCEQDLMDFFKRGFAADRRVTVRAGGQSLDSQSLGRDIVLIVDSKGLSKIGPPEQDESGFHMTAGAGARWLEVITTLAPYGLMPPSLQTGGEATVGGTLSADCLSRMSAIVGKEGAHIRSFKIVLADGRLVECRRHDPNATRNALYRAVIGGFGYLGVVTEVTFDLVAARNDAGSHCSDDWPRVFTRSTRFAPTADWGSILRSLQSRSEERRNSYRKNKAAHHGFSYRRGDPRAPPIRVSEWSALSVAAFMAGDAFEANLLEQRYTAEPLRPTPGGVYARDGSVNAVAERIDSWWPTAAELVLDFGWPEGEFVDDLLGWAFFLGNSTTRAKAEAHALGYRLHFIQQSFVLPSVLPGERGDRSLDTRPARRFIELLLARAHAADLRPGPVDLLYVGSDEDVFLMSASRGLPGFVITVAFVDRDRVTLRPAIGEFLRTLSHDCLLLGGRVHLVKNVVADAADLRAMHGDAAKAFRELKAEHDPKGIFRNEFYAKVFEA
jgi:FAD/FMN-containing dehydrogenase